MLPLMGHQYLCISFLHNLCMFQIEKGLKDGQEDQNSKMFQWLERSAEIQ